MSDGKRGGGDRGGGGGGKRHKSRYVPGKGAKTSSAIIPHGIRGFFFSCENGRENKTAHQMMETLNSLYEKLCPSAAKETEAEAQDIQASLEAEIADLREKKNQRFHKLDLETGKGLGFIKMAYSLEGPTPQDLAQALVEDVRDTKEKTCRFIMRVLPVTNTCYTSKEDIEKYVKPLIEEHFPAGEGVTPVKFSVVLEVRANNSIPKNELIDLVAKLVPKPHSVDLTKPDKSVLVFLIKNVCLLGVVYKYHDFAKYNCNVLAMSEEERAELCKKTTAPGTQPGPSKKLAEGDTDSPAKTEEAAKVAEEKQEEDTDTPAKTEEPAEVVEEKQEEEKE
mmetsp:Transcript_5723/g.9881  ORF Transcript_5723/g.9881 Transcript_5723/m.9881 type:complete len:336 (+) Transcript_5723:218-1225(+)|eukprot:CAMPEP_0198211592 /NCGR_PEP_ID=MMETSP1445-20131203/24644_1 /TAXON_ID=36898 /ORGANISM="Pyramimonas sp., Strain CCMP2087" /LENGTH=335 /DNA_ID=CAMNT_0043885873 /DNA_START=201 /DNA_END=1208 /DNA_ORIENTATION=+